jgi:hypothetical protein
VDGIFGPGTAAAVRGFQKALHLDMPSVTVDGIVGPVTWQALVSGMLFLLTWEPDRSSEGQVTDRCLAGFDRATRCLEGAAQMSEGVSRLRRLVELVCVGVLKSRLFGIGCGCQ